MNMQTRMSALDGSSRSRVAFNVVRAAWLIWVLFALISGLLTYSEFFVDLFGWVGRLNRIRFDSQLVVGLSGHPLGIYGPGAVHDVLALVGTDIGDGPVGYTIGWLVLAGFGYLQWFVIIPLVFRLVGSWLGLRRKS